MHRTKKAIFPLASFEDDRSSPWLPLGSASKLTLTSRSGNKVAIRWTSLSDRLWDHLLGRLDMRSLPTWGCGSSAAPAHAAPHRQALASSVGRQAALGEKAPGERVWYLDI